MDIAVSKVLKDEKKVASCYQKGGDYRRVNGKTWHRI
jgi:hypothetical protein